MPEVPELKATPHYEKEISASQRDKITRHAGRQQGGDHNDRSEASGNEWKEGVGGGEIWLGSGLGFELGLGLGIGLGSGSS